ncbi:MAG: hypothetical protein C0478_08835 [Planctomyces sp.]|nr:hypothetical protein [Planctomyces sp.]
MPVASSKMHADLTLVNGSTGDPVLLIDYPDRDDALLLDGGENGSLSLEQLADLTAVFITHHHIDHFIGLDRIVRANMDRDKTLSLFGPPGTIEKVADRIRSYEFQFFPFQKIVIDVCDVHADRLVTGRLDCGKRFPPPEIREVPRCDRMVFKNETVQVEAVFADHTVPCLSYAVIEKPGWFLESSALQKSHLKPGPWIAEVLGRLRQTSPDPSPIHIDGGTYPLATLRDKFFRLSSGARLAFITDTFWSDEVRKELLSLAHRANLLYCDSFYLSAQASQAQKYRHMTALQAGELARLANVERLILIHFAQRYAGRYEPLVEEARAEFANVTAEIR